jgi:hypothetical protein
MGSPPTPGEPPRRRGRGCSFEVVQAHHQPRGGGGPPRPLAVVSPEMLVEAPPVDLSGQPHQGVPLVEQIRQSRPLHRHLPLILTAQAGSWLHPPILQENRPKSTKTLQYLDSGTSRKRRLHPHPPIFQDRLLRGHPLSVSPQRPVDSLRIH